MPDHLGWDIGGVHLKLSWLRSGAGGRLTIQTHIIPFEIWSDPGGLPRQLRAILGAASEAAGGPAGIAAHGVTMTAELSDVFPSRTAGVRAILEACAEALAGAPLRVLDLTGRFVSLDRALERPLDVAAANWLATARLAGRLAPNALVIDVGSTTSDITPIREGRPCPSGLTDTERLISGELVYTGALRTPPASLASAVPLFGRLCRLSPESFAIMADVYRVLGRIEEGGYTVRTPDGRGKSRAESAARLARIVCSDPATLGEERIEAIAACLEGRQIDRLAGAIQQVLSADRRVVAGPARGPAVVAGAGSFLATAAAERAGLRPVALASLLDRVAGAGWDRAAPSAAIALLLAEESGERPFEAAGDRDPGGRRG